MKICLFMAGQGEGGLENHVVDLANGLAKRHDVHVIAHPSFRGRFAKGVRFSGEDFQKSRFNPALLWRLVKNIRSIRPDIVHAHANKAVSMLARTRPLLPKHTKLMGTLHNEKRKLTDFDRLDYVIGVSDRVLQRVKNPHKRTVHNGVSVDGSRLRDRSYFNQWLPEETVKSQPIVVNLGRLVEAKRIDRSLRCFTSIKDAALVIVGDGPKRAELEQLAHELGLSNVHFLGYRTDAIELLSAADVCLISSDREGLPYVMLESLMVRTPIIATDMADMKQILPPAYVVERSDEAGLTACLARSLSDLNAVNRDYEPVFQWAADNLSKARMIEKTEDVYASLTAGMPDGNKH